MDHRSMARQKSKCICKFCTLLQTDLILACADIVFLSSTDASAQTEHYVALCCARADKPLIRVEHNSLSSLEEVLGTWCPMA